MSGERWLIVQSRFASGDRMEQWLKGLKSCGCETYYPMIRELKRVPQRELTRAQRLSNVTLMRPRVVAFLPGHVFVRGGRRVLEHPGVLGVVSFGSEPARISDALIERLRERERAGEGGVIPGATLVEMIFRPGDPVEVLNGPFAMFRGIVEKQPNVPIERIDADTRLRLTLEVFGRRTPVEIAVADIRKL